MHERSLVEYQNTDKKLAINYILNSAGQEPQIKQTVSVFHFYVLHFIIPLSKGGPFSFLFCFGKLQVISHFLNVEKYLEWHWDD